MTYLRLFATMFAAHHYWRPRWTLGHIYWCHLWALYGYHISREALHQEKHHE